MRGTLQKEQNRTFPEAISRTLPGLFWPLRGLLLASSWPLPGLFRDFRPPKATEMRGTPQKQQNRQFRKMDDFAAFVGFPSFRQLSAAGNPENLRGPGNGFRKRSELRNCRFCCFCGVLLISVGFGIRKKRGRGQRRGEKRPGRGQKRPGRGQKRPRKRPGRGQPPGGGPGMCQQKPSGLGSVLYIPLPWEVPEGPACMVPVA